MTIATPHVPCHVCGHIAATATILQTMTVITHRDIRVRPCELIR